MELVNNGVLEREAMAILGHKTRSMFDRYHVVDVARQRAAVRKAWKDPEAKPGS